MSLRIRFSALVFAVLAVFAVSLSLMPAVSAGVYQAETVKDGGTIAGVVKFDGTAPKPELIDISKDRNVCGRVPHYDRSLMVGADGGIANAVVAITDISKGAPLKPVQGVKFDQIACEYVPRVIAFPAGSTVDVLNSDGILHTVSTDSRRNPPIDMAQPGFKKLIKVRIRYPELIHVTCDAHSWMHGWWYAAGNPYYAVTDSHGRFEIKNVPAGTYTLKLWQEKLGTQTRQVTVKPAKAVTVDFTMGPKKD